MSDLTDSSTLAVKSNNIEGNRMIKDSNISVFEKVHPEYFPYYRSWCHDLPILVTGKRDEELHRVADVLYKCAEYYVHHYKDYLQIIPYTPEILEILEYASQYPFRAGTFRPDYIIDEKGNILLCEITSRFFGNGYFMSYFMEKAGEDMANALNIQDRRSYFPEFFDYMASMAEGYSRLLVLKSADKSDSIKLYVPFYHALGMETIVLEAEEVENNLDLFEGSMIVSALNQKDLLSFDIETRHAMADHGMRNDFRTIFLLHDKRFFHLFFQDEFTKQFLTEEETDFLRKHTIKTILAGTETEIWEDARRNKDNYIIKHSWLGKSEKVFAGCLTSEDEWGQIFTSDDLGNMILQPFIKQKRYSGPFKEEILNDYVSPSIFTIDDRYFGTGLFRTSSCPVINQGDAHKMVPILSNELLKDMNHRKYYIL